MEFWLISSAEVATPPALAALPGPKSTPLCWKQPRCASRVVGMLAPSATHMTPFLIERLGACSSIQLVLGRAGQGDVAGNGPDALAALVILGRAGTVVDVFLDAAARGPP